MKENEQLAHKPTDIQKFLLDFQAQIDKIIKYFQAELKNCIT